MLPLSRRAPAAQRPTWSATATSARAPPTALPRVRAAVRPRPEAPTGARRPEGVGPPPAAGADEPAGDRPRHRPVPLVAPDLRQRPVPGRHAARAGAAQKKSGEIVIEAGEWWVWVA